ncbi:MAG: serine protease Do [Paraglaciecola sp.]|jgi:S1-C subfamily serine protease
MKKVISYIVAGMMGGFITLGGSQLLQSNTSLEKQKISLSKEVNNINKAPVVNNTPFDFKEAANIAMPAVVHIHAKQVQKKVSNQQRSNDPWEQLFGGDLFFGSPFGNQMPKEGTGSGVIYTADGYIVTNNHVVEFADEIEVTTYDNKKFSASKVGTYPQSDLAVLKIEATNLPVLQFADSEKAMIGEWVLAVGNPLELKSTVTAGIISAKGRDIDIIQDNEGAAIESFIQTDAAVNPGNSGGALVDVQGRLLGINTAIATRTGFFQGYSFAIPVNVVTNIVDDIIENGSYERGFLGINIAEMTSEDATELGLNISQGVLVDNVTNGGAAQYAGVLPNDVIVGANQQRVRSMPELLEIVGSAKVGDVVDLEINRYGKIIDLPVRLKAGK